MDIHICNKCELINEVITNKIKWYDSVNSENISLHHSLQNITYENVLLRKQIRDMYTFLYEEREQYLKLYSEREILKILTKHEPKILGDSLKTFQKQIHYSNESSNKSDKKQILAIKSAFEKENSVYKCQIQSLLKDRALCEKELVKEIHCLQEYNNRLIKSLQSCREELFKTKKDHLQEYSEVISYISFMKEENKIKLLRQLESQKSILKEEIKNRTKNVLQSTRTQLQNRDDLVVILRRQCVALEKEMNLLRNEKISSENSHKDKCRKLRKEMENLAEKRNALLTQRKLEGEGYKTDIKNLKRQIQQLEKKSGGKIDETHCANILQNLNKLQVELDTCY